MKRIQHFLSGKTVGIVAAIIAVIAINCWQLVLNSVNDDSSYSIAAAQNIAEGHGYSIKMASTDDLSLSYYEPLNKWPPGYSWLLILVQKLSGTDWIRATYLLNGMALTALVLVFRKMLFQLEITAWFIPIAVLWFGFMLQPFLPGFTDIMGVLFFAFGLSILLHYIKSERKSLWTILLAAIVLSFCAFLKYLYLGLAAVPFFCLFVYGFQQKRRGIRQSAVGGFVLVTLFIGSLLLFQQFHSGGAFYIHPAKTGFFPEQLPWTGPMIIDKFMNLNFYSLQISLHTGIAYLTAAFIWGICNLLCVAWLAFISFTLIKKKRLSGSGYRSFYAFLAIMISGSLFLLLGILSVRINKYYDARTPFWIYSHESRYYGIFGIFIFQFSVYLFLSARNFFGNRGAIIFRLLIIGIICGEIGHATYYFYKKIGIEKNFGIHGTDAQISLKAIQQTRIVQLKNENAVLCSNSEKINNFCRLTGIAAIYDLQLLDKPIQSSRPVLLITIINSKESFLIPAYFRTLATKLEYEDQGVYYFISRIPKTTIN